MNYLVDTHVFLWWLDGNENLPLSIRKLIKDKKHNFFVSAASAWEISTKVRIGKLPGAVEVAQLLPECIVQNGFTALAITVHHAQRASLLPGVHRDPFDRMLAAQAISENIPIVSKDNSLDLFGVRRVWVDKD